MKRVEGSVVSVAILRSKHVRFQKVYIYRRQEAERFRESNATCVPARYVLIHNALRAMARMYFLQWALALCRLANKVSAL